jgi:hypothetical protein
MGVAARELFMSRFTVDAMADGLLEVVHRYAPPTLAGAA